MITIQDVIDGETLGQKGSIRCPFHNDTHASAYYYPNGAFHCFTCQAHAKDRVDLVRKLRYPDLQYGIGLSLARAELDARGVVYVENTTIEKPEVPQVTVDAMTAFTRLASKLLAQKPDLTNGLRLTRGVQSPTSLGLGLSDQSLVTPTAQSLMSLGYSSDEIAIGMEQAGILRGPRYLLGNRITIPEIRSKKSHFYQARNLNSDRPKYLNPPIPRTLFGMESLSYDKPYVVVCEGPFDILPLIEQGIPSIALLGTGLGITDLPVEGRQVLLALDQDDAGRALTERLTKILTDDGIEVMSMSAPPPYKDYGEWITAKSIKEVIATIELSR
jgi:DNA primase